MLAAVLALVFLYAPPEGNCSTVTLQFHCLRQPPVYQLGETIQAELRYTGTSRAGYSLSGAPEARRSHFPLEETIISDPETGTIDPASRNPRIWAGSVLGSFWSGAKPLIRRIDINEWIQFQRPGRYTLHVISNRITSCELQSNPEQVEILAPDGQWESAELARIAGVLGSTTGITRLRAASELRYLGTRDAAGALVRWYLQLAGGEANAELREGILETEHADIVQSGLEAALDSGQPLPYTIADTLAALEVRKEFANRPAPTDEKAKQARSNEYWDRFASLKKQYSARIRQPIH
jgi:hypothetical protein